MVGAGLVGPAPAVDTFWAVQAQVEVVAGAPTRPMVRTLSWLVRLLATAAPTVEGPSSGALVAAPAPAGLPWRSRQWNHGVFRRVVDRHSIE